VRRAGGLAIAALLAGCNSSSEPPVATSSSEAATPAASAPAPAASDPDPTKAGALWLDRQTEPRQAGKYAPRDECGALPGARAFREKLAAAILARDAEAIAGMASEDVRLGFGGDDGRKRFLARLKAPDGKLIDALAELLPLGCVATDGGGLTIPWVFAQDMGDIDSYSAMLVTGVDVPLRASAKADAAAMERVSWDVVTLTGSLRPDAAFQQVRTRSGKTGYMASDRLRSLLDYRLLAVRNGDAWRITALLAGD
jgi:hypothetical protein